MKTMTPKPKEAKHLILDFDVEKSQGEGAFERVFIGAEKEGGIGELYTDSEGWKERAAYIKNAVNNYDRDQETKRELLEVAEALREVILSGETVNQVLGAKLESAIQNARRG